MWMDMLIVFLLLVKLYKNSHCDKVDIYNTRTSLSSAIESSSVSLWVYYVHLSHFVTYKYCEILQLDMLITGREISEIISHTFCDLQIHTSYRYRHTLSSIDKDSIDSKYGFPIILIIFTNNAIKWYIMLTENYA